MQPKSLIFLPIPLLICVFAGCNSTTTEPDLAFSSIVLGDSAPATGVTETVTVTVANVGSAASGSYRYAWSLISASGSTLASGTDSGTSIDSAGNGTLTLSVSPGSAFSGTATLTITLDPAGSISEEDENNNVATTSITWGGTANDLSLDSVSGGQSSYASAKGYASFTLTNSLTTATTVYWRVQRTSDAAVLSSGAFTVSGESSKSSTQYFYDTDYSGEYQLGIATSSDFSDETAETFAFTWSASG
jgi:hypothetical protein